MRDITYSSIRMLVDSADVAGDTVKCVFTCPVTGAAAEATGRIPAEVSEELAGKLDDVTLYGRVRSVLGCIVRDMVGTPSVPGSRGGEVGEERKRAGILDAFRKVAHRFAFDPQSREWLSASAAERLLTPFGVQLNKAPVENERDVEIAQRMLVEVARADGVFDERERAMLAQFLGLGESDDDRVDERVGELAAAGELTAGELRGVTGGGVRKTMLMLACAAAFTDETLGDAERAVLAQFGKDLGLPADDVAEAERLARDFVIDTAFDQAWANLEVEPGERRHILSLARKLGVTADDVARIEEAYRKRTGRDEQ